MEKLKITESRIIIDLPPSEGNPRNSEGDFARLNNGDILFAYSRYHGDSSSDDADCSIAALISHDNGESFSPLGHDLARASEHGVKNVMSVTLRRNAEGRLCLFYLCKKGPYSEMYLKFASPEDETVFGEPVCCIPKKNGAYYVVNNCRVCLLPDGRFLIPAAHHRVRRRPGRGLGMEYFAVTDFFVSDKSAENWSLLCGGVSMPLPAHSRTGLQEPGVIMLPDGRLYAYFRTDRMFQFESFSEDSGKSWSKPVPSRFTAPESPMLITRDPFCGKYYSFWNPVPLYNGRLKPGAPWVTAGRTPFAAAVSDNGLDFSEPVNVEDDPERGFCYPAAMFLGEGEMLLSYCCGGAQDGNCLTRLRIRHIVFG